MTDLLNEKLKTAVLEENLEQVEHLVSVGGDVNYFNSDHLRTLLHIVRDSKIAEILLKNGADVNAIDTYGMTPLCYAAASRKLDIVELFLSFGASVGAENTYTPLHFASTSEIALELLSHGANVNALDTYRRTPLVTAIIDKKEFSLVKTLMNAGAYVDMKLDLFENTLLHYADSFDITKELLLRGCDVNALTIKRQTPLHYAVKHMKETAVVQKILEYGVNINAMDNEGHTALIYAIRSHHKNVNVIKLLLEYGADITIASFDYSHFRLWTPLDSVIHNDLSIARLLIKLAILRYSDTFLIHSYIKSNIPRESLRRLQLYLNECSSEISKMKNCSMSHNLSLFDIATKKDVCVKPLYKGFRELEEEMFINYPIYHDIIMPILMPFLERGRLFNKLKELQIYLVDSCEHKICLNTDCALLIAEYLSEESLYNLILTFESIIDA